MRHELPKPNEILEELVDKAAVQIDRLAPVAFDSSLGELIRYHRFLLDINATQTQDGTPFNYAAIPGEALQAPHSRWINQYRRLFERAASRIGDDSDFIEKLAYLPVRLLQGRDNPQMSDDIVQAIVDLGVILIHQIEAWVTKRTVADTMLGTAAGPRMYLAGSDAKSYASLLPTVVGAWESLLQSVSTLYHWRNDREAPPEQRWDALRKGWPFVWKHLRDTAYMLAVSVWNEDETGAASYRDALVRWPRSLHHHFPDRVHLPHRRLLFPDIFSLGLSAAQERIQPVLLSYMPAPTPEELFSEVFHGAHDDVVLLTSALLLLWSMEEKQVSDIGARTAVTLLRRQLEDTDDGHDLSVQDKSFTSLALDIIRLEMAGDHYPDNTYGAEIDHLVARLDNMTERRVVPGRVFTPSTLNGRDGLQVAMLAILLAKIPSTENSSLADRVRDIAKNESALPRSDRSLRDILRDLDRLLKLLEAPPAPLSRGFNLLISDADFSGARASARSAIAATIKAIETTRNERLREKPIDSRAIDSLRDAAERAITNPPGGVSYFRGFSIEIVPKRGDSLFAVPFRSLNKAQFVNPPMESPPVGFTEHYASLIAQHAGRRVLKLFSKRARENVAIAFRLEEPSFWERVESIAKEVGAEPILIISGRARARCLRNLIRGTQKSLLKIERKSAPHDGHSYVATIEGIDVYGDALPSGKAWLFSPYLLQSLRYAALSDEGHIVRVNFQPTDDLHGQLLAQADQTAVWADWPIYEIDCDDPEM